MKTLHTQTGIGLIELILYIALIGLIIGPLSMAMFTSDKVFVTQSVVKEVDEQAAYALEYVAQRIREAEDVSLPIAGASGSVLALDVRDAADDPVLIEVDSGVLIVTEDADGIANQIALTNSHVTVTQFLVTNVSRAGTPGAIRITMTLSYTGSGSGIFDHERVFYATASLR